MSDNGSKSRIASFLWEGLDGDLRYTQNSKSGRVENFNHAVAIGTRHLALYFTIDNDQPQNARHFTNTAMIQNAADIAAYLKASGATLESEMLSRMFSRVADKKAEQSKYDAIATVADALDALKTEPPGTFFLTPGNGGFIKLRDGDTAYDRTGKQVWPRPSASP
jgi:hypothetical protein